MDAKQLTEGQKAYEAKRAAKAGMTLEAWLRDKEKRAKAEAAEAAKTTAPEPAKKPGFFTRLLERAQKPL
jgi:3-hydroxyisobutyrate dehydrogenase-like beta-hydroxyacid dehydrogenase